MAVIVTESGGTVEIVAGNTPEQVPLGERQAADYVASKFTLRRGAKAFTDTRFCNHFSR